MKCPKCEKRMFKNNNVWECSNCGFNFITTDDKNIFTNLKNSAISNKIKDYSENSDTFGKVVDGVENIGEQVVNQAKKEESYIKVRLDNDSNSLLDENEFFISKYVFDGADYVKNKKQEIGKYVNTKHPQKKQNINVNDINEESENTSETIKRIEGTVNREAETSFEKIKQGEKIIKEYMGTSSFKNKEFNSKMRYSGVPLLKTNAIWKKINKQAKNELKEGILELDNIPERLDELLVEFGKEAENRPENALFYVNGTEASLAIFEDFIELDFTGDVLKKVFSGMGGVKKIYYPQITGIQKRDAGSVLSGSIEFEVPGMSFSRDWSDGKGQSENMIHYEYYYQDEIDKIYEFVNQKILDIQKSKRNPQPTPSNETSVLSEIKKAKELLDMGIITQEEFDKIKKDLLN